MEVKQGYRQTELGVLPQDWEVSLLDSVAKRGSGHTPDKAHPEYWNGQIKWISLQDSDRLDHLYIYDTAAKITQQGIANSSAKMHPEGTVVLSRDAGVGKSAIMKDDMAVSQHFIAWQCGPLLNNHFLYYWLQANKSEFQRIAMGNTIKTIGLPYFRQLVIPRPTRAEQEAIAEALSDADALIESLQQLIVKKRHIKQGAMQELLSGRKRAPGFGQTEWKRAKIGEVPTDWRILDIGQVASVKTGPFGSTLHEKDYVDDGTPIVTVEHLGERGLMNNNLPMVSSADRKRLVSYSLQEGDIVFSRVGSVDRNARVSKNEVGWLFSGRLLRVRASAEVDSRYLSYHFNSAPFKGRVKTVAVGQTMASLNTKILQSVSVILPPLEEQIAIAVILSDMDTELAALEAKLAKARHLKQAMMQELLTGRVRLV